LFLFKTICSPTPTQSKGRGGKRGNMRGREGKGEGKRE